MRSNLFLLLTIVSGLYFNALTMEWFGPETHYVFAPGIFSSEHQVAKYTNFYRATTGQEITSSHGFELVQGRTTLGCNFAEIMFPNQLWLFNGLREQLNRLALSILNKSNQYYQIEIGQAAELLNSLTPYYIALWRLNFGQELDCWALKRTIEQAVERNGKNPLVLYGVSRGAAAIVNWISFFKDLQKNFPIKAIVLESCFDSLTRISPLSIFFSYICPFYNPRGMCPINPGIINYFVQFCNRQNISVLVISSTGDQRVPFKNTQCVVSALKRAGLKNLYFLKLEDVVHSDYLSGNPIVGATYQSVVHAFYETVGVAHIPHFAEHGREPLHASKIS